MQKVNKLEFLEVFALIVIPGIASVYFGAATLLNFEGTVYILGTLSVVALALGFVVAHLKRKYFDDLDGELHLMDLDGERKRYSLVLRSDPEELTNKRVITFEVVQNRE